MAEQTGKELADKIQKNIQKVLVGKEKVTELLLTALIADGHVLLEDVPGTGKTKLAKHWQSLWMCSSPGCSSLRICCQATSRASMSMTDRRMNSPCEKVRYLPIFYWRTN